MAELIVHHFKLVDIQHRRRHAELALSDLFKQFFQLAQTSPPVGNQCQGVGIGVQSQTVGFRDVDRMLKMDKPSVDPGDQTIMIAIDALV